MKQQFLIISDDFTPEQLHNWVSEVPNSNPDISFELVKEQEKTRSLTPEVLAALAGGGVGLIGVMLQLIVTAVIAKYQKNVVTADTTITIKGKNGREISFPVNTPQEKIDELINLAAKLEEVEYVAITEE